MQAANILISVGDTQDCTCMFNSNGGHIELNKFVEIVDGKAICAKHHTELPNMQKMAREAEAGKPPTHFSHFLTARKEERSLCPSHSMRMACIAISLTRP